MSVLAPSERGIPMTPDWRIPRCRCMCIGIRVRLPRINYQQRALYLHPQVSGASRFLESHSGPLRTAASLREAQLSHTYIEPTSNLPKR